jgi:predicted SAM-dependent methyltransferase
VKKPLRLNLGCGDVIMEGWINVDLFHPKAQVRADAKDLCMFDNSVDEIYASHLIEHFDFQEGLKALKEWYRVLKIGGKLVIETPDFEAFCKNFLKLPDVEQPKYYGIVWGYPWLPGHAHKFGYTPTQMFWSLKQIGFTNIRRTPALRFLDAVDWCMRFESEK